MMYFEQIMGYLAWPLMILASYVLVRLALLIFENRYNSGEPSDEK